MAQLELRNVTKRYENGFEAVSNFNLDIQDKEFIIFVGPSGCGKSTTLRMIAGLEEASEGEIWIDDRLVNYVEPKDRDLSMVFQNYALYPNMTVYDNIAFSLQVRRLPKKEIDNRVREVARILEIENLLDRRPKDLSGGQKQRVAIGNAIIRRPKALLMDEPLSNLDAKLRGQMRVELAKLHERLDTTFIYVTHDQTEAMTLGTRIVVMKDGRIQQADTPKMLYEHPVNRFVAGFIGSPAMNFLEGVVCCEEKKLWLRCGARMDFELTWCSVYSVLTDYIAKTVTAGIRPEDIYLEEEYRKMGQEEQKGLKAVKVTVTARELLGAENILYFQAGENDLIAKVGPECAYRSGEEITLYFDTKRMHFFDAGIGMNVERCELG
ncbi:MAG: ABC transporter ATP-binding protein [Lachnospiraceae bacterium]|nr:ABC transporter ATP-binding protein [Lachnospiraceae bacterium]